MNRSSLRLATLFVLPFALLLFGHAFGPRAGAQTPVFGPEKYVRDAAEPAKIVKTFSAPNTAETFYLNIVNGEGGEGRVTSAVVELNGQRVAGPGDFGKSVGEITKRVTLEAQNTLAVELRGAPGTSLAISVFQPPRFFLFTHPADPLLLRAETAEGDTVEYFGGKDGEGLATSLDSIVWRRASGETTKYFFDPQSRPVKVEASNGLIFTFEWQTNTFAQITVTSADGSMQVTAPVDFSPQAAALRARNTRDGGGGCCGGSTRRADARSPAPTFSRANYLPGLSAADTRWFANAALGHDFLRPGRLPFLKSSYALRPGAQSQLLRACAAMAQVLGRLCEVLDALTIGGAIPLNLVICPALAVAAGANPATLPLAALLFQSCQTTYLALQTFCALNQLSMNLGGPALVPALCDAIKELIDTPSAPPPAPVVASINIPCTTANYLNVFWSRSAEPNFAAYRLYRDTQAGVTTSDQLIASVTDNTPVSFFRRDGGLAPGRYFYKVFVSSQSGGSAGSNEVSGRIFAPGEVLNVIPGVPEPNDSNFPAQVVVPSFVNGLVQFDCTQRNALDPNNCDGSFAPIGPRIDCSGHVLKTRTFPTAAIQGSLLNGIPNVRYIVHLGDVVRIAFLAQDDGYTFTQPDFGLQLNIPQGSQRNLEFSPTSTGTFALLIQDSGGGATTAGTLTVLP